MNPIRRCLPLLPIACCALGALPAQIPQGTTFEPVERVISWPAGPGNMRGLIGCYWDTVEHRSAVGLRGTATHRAIAPGITKYVKAFSAETVVDLVTLPGGGIDDPTPGDQRRDAVLMSVVGGAELRLLYVDAAGTEVVVPIPMPGWFRCSNFCARKDGNGWTVTALANGGTVLLRMLVDQQLNFVQMVNVVPGVPIRAHCLADYDNDGELDAFVMTDTAVNVYDPAGGILLSRALAHAGGSLVAVPEPVQRHAVALLQRNAGNTGWELVHIDQGVIEPPVAISNAGADFNFLGLLAGDGDGDDDSDLAILFDSTKVLLVPNESEDPTTPHFDGSHANVIAASNLPGTLGKSVFCDFDYDGTADLLLSLLGPTGNLKLVLKTGLSLAFNTISATYYPDIFGDSFHDLAQTAPLWLAQDRLMLNLLLTDELSTYESIRVSLYEATEGYVAGGGYVQEWHDSGLLDLTAHLDPITQMASIPFSVLGINMDYPNLEFVKVQLSSSDNPTKKPTFLGGLTIDNDLQIDDDLDPDFGSDFIDDNRLPNSTDKNVKRERPESGRQHIGLVTPMKVLPLKW